MRGTKPLPSLSWAADDDDELNTNPPTPCQIGKRPPAPKPKENWPAFRESQVEGRDDDELMQKARH